MNKIVPPNETCEAAQTLAQVIANKSPMATQLIKESLRNLERGSVTSDRKVERMLFSLVHSSQNSKEGIEAYLSKRAPQFSDE